MKVIKRIIFCVILFCILLISIYSLYNTYVLFTRNIDGGPGFLAPILIGIFSFFSFLFNLKKLIPRVFINKIIYTILRIGDFIFSIIISISLSINIYHTTKEFVQQELQFETYLFRVLILLVMLVLSIFLFLDNLKYHKEQKKEKEFVKRQIINEIGK